MGRPTKEGLDYFPMDIDIFEDHKILLAQELIDPDGNNPHARLIIPYIAIRLLREIYKNGYFMEWNRSQCLTLSSKIGCGITIGLLENFTNCLLTSGFFNTEIYNKFNVLTSKGIQSRWHFIVKSSNRKKVFINPDFELLTFEKKLSTEETQKSTEETQKSTEESAKIEEESAQIIFTITNTNVNNKVNTILSNNIDNVSTNNSNNSKSTEETQKSTEETQKSTEETQKSTEETQKSTEETQKSTEETQKSTEETIIQINNGYLLYPINQCLWNFFNNRQFDRTKEQAIQMLHLTDNPKDAEDVLKKWGEAFNRKCVGEGLYEYQMTGKSGWTKYFPLWVNRLKSEINNPDSLYTNKHKPSDYQKSTKDTGRANVVKKSKVQEDIETIDEQIKNEADPIKRNELMKKKYEAPIRRS